MKKIIKEKCHDDEFLTLKDLLAYQQFCISYNNIIVYTEATEVREHVFFSKIFIPRVDSR